MLLSSVSTQEVFRHFDQKDISMIANVMTSQNMKLLMGIHKYVESI